MRVPGYTGPMRSKKKHVRRRRIRAVAASGAAVVAALAGALLLRRRTASDTSDAAADGDPRGEWRCECGEPLLVSGEGRHRVFWPVGAAPGDPLLEDRCPNCHRVLSLQDQAVAGR